MKAKHIRSLSRLLKGSFPQESEENEEHVVKSLQLKILRIQQALWSSKKRAIIVFEGFDASGKGGAIRRLTESLDPRGLKVHAIGPPLREEQDKHYLYRFWKAMPEPGTLAIFDRSWYGRVLVEKVEKLAPKHRLREAYDEINEFEKNLVDDGIDLIKIFLAIHPEEQLKRFEARIHDPFKRWKLTEDDLKAHAKWDKYVEASDEILKRNNTKYAPWHLIPADSKPFARMRALEIVTDGLDHHFQWIKKQKRSTTDLRHQLEMLEKA